VRSHRFLVPSVIMTLRTSIVSTVKAACRGFGLKVERFNLATSQELRLARMLKFHGVDVVLDVGASSGGYGRNLRMAGYRGRILSFEPLRSVHGELVRRTANDSGWAVAPPMAVGDQDGRNLINVAGNSDSSSLLDMLAAHSAAAPDSRYVAAEEVDVRRLDGVSHPFIDDARSPFLKVDTQGYEAHVIAGAAGLMPRLRGIQIEMSLESLYRGQTLWRDLMAGLESEGFRLWSLVPGFFDTASGRLLQCDGVFFRPCGDRS